MKMRRPVINKAIYRKNNGHKFNALCCAIHTGCIHYLCVAWLDVTEEEDDNDKEKSTEKIKPAPPSTRDFDAICKDISEWLSVLNKIEQLSWYSHSIVLLCHDIITCILCTLDIP